MQWRKGLGAAGAIAIGAAITALLALGGRNLSAQEVPPANVPPAPAPTGEKATALSPLEGAKILVNEAWSKLNPNTVGSLRESDFKNTAQIVVNLLEGQDGEHYDSAVAVSDPYGAIPYLEDVTGRSAADLAGGDLETIAASTEESPEVVALAHLILADQVLTAGEVNQEVLQTAAHHIHEAYNTLSGASSGATGGTPEKGGAAGEQSGY